MDSEEDSRPGSSASNSSDASSAPNDNNNSDNSRPSTPNDSGDENIHQKSQSNSPEKSNNSDSNSSSSSSDEEHDDNAENNLTIVNRLNNSQNANDNCRRSSRSSSQGSGDGRVSRNQSISPVRRKSHSSRSSSSSSENSNKSTKEHNDEDENDLNKDDGAINMSHEDLSDVSDLDNDKDRVKNKQPYAEEEEKSIESTDETKSSKKEIGNDEYNITDLRQKLDLKKHQLKTMEAKENNDMKATNGKLSESSSICDDLIKKHDEDALDFEAEEGECPDLSKEDEQMEKELTNNAQKEKKTIKANSEALEEGEELEEGEVSDEEEKRPEETEPKPVCRFYTRGQCTWGMSCRFLHPGVTDKGNYTMFDMVRPVPISHGIGGADAPAGAHRPPNFGHSYPDYRTERPPLHHRPPVIHHPHAAFGGAPIHHERHLPPIVNDPVVPPMVESAWERGLRTAKEMMRKANKRKEQDMDFEDKKMNLTLSPDELEKDNYYIRDRGSPEATPPYPPRSIHPPIGYGHEPGIYSPPGPGVTRIIRGPPPPAGYDEVDPYGRSARYRELPPHRMPQYEDERRVRPAREVIVQRVEPVGRGDEWNDPWMRSKSPGRDGRDRSHHEKRMRRERRSYSSNSSYTSSSTSRSGSSSESSRSPTPDNRRRRYNSTQSSHKSPQHNVRRHVKGGLRSPSPQVQRRRRSPSPRRSPITMKKRNHMSPSPILDKRMPISPSAGGGKRRKISPQSRKLSSGEKLRSKKRRGATSSSGSGSSESSGSDSESSCSSSSSSTSRDKTPIKRVPAGRPVEKTSVVERKIAKKEIAAKKRSPISIELKKTSNLGVSALTVERETNLTAVTAAAAAAANNKKTTRREELLKQLRAVEDAIARKKSKLN